jgi:hypothetical protein
MMMMTANDLSNLKVRFALRSPVSLLPLRRLSTLQTRRGRALYAKTIRLISTLFFSHPLFFTTRFNPYPNSSPGTKKPSLVRSSASGRSSSVRVAWSRRCFWRSSRNARERDGL